MREEREQKREDLCGHNEQLNCNCTATGFALSRVCIFIGILSTMRSERREKSEERRKKRKETPKEAAKGPQRGPERPLGLVAPRPRAREGW